MENMDDVIYAKLGLIKYYLFNYYQLEGYYSVSIADNNNIYFLIKKKFFKDVIFVISYNKFYKIFWLDCLLEIVTAFKQNNPRWEWV